jgi:hypothetical protein
MPNIEENIFVYHIDEEDIIVSVSPNWESFARANAWASELTPNKVVGHPLWDFIQDPETRHLYRELFNRVRDGSSCRSIPFRCDSPRERRYLSLGISLQRNDHIEITSTILKIEPRDPVGLLEKDRQRSTDLLRICSMCKKIAATRNNWVEIEEGLTQLKLFEARMLPQLTHGICPDCYQSVMADLDDL